MANTIMMMAAAVTALLALDGALALSGGPYYGDGTHYGKGGDWNGWCKGFGKGNGWPGLPTVAMNAEQFENGGACGVCISGYGTGKGAGYTPIVGNFFVTVNNLCPECHHGAIDFCDDGDGRWQIIWYIVDCASHGRHLLANNITVNEHIGDFIKPRSSAAHASAYQLDAAAGSASSTGGKQAAGATQARRMLHSL
ncbi:hypothetical protein WJX81_002256 [Elliptochloris bilobata]|uniref:Expansin-like EG45 domain-containing protein n=1 Tax=Elliptochloris bilobata TaxID=381761 RepID=A0AAW1QY08_9CHLO